MPSGRVRSGSALPMHCDVVVGVDAQGFDAIGGNVLQSVTLRRLDFAPGRFLRSKGGDLVCAVHGATFALPQGNCVAGPCRGDCLRAVPVHVADGEVRLGEAG